MNDPAPHDVRELLRQVPYPGTTRNIVSAGFVRGAFVDGVAVTVKFMPNSTDATKVAAMEDGIKDVLHGAGFTLVRVDTEAPFDDASMLLGTGSMNPLQAELLEDGVDPQPDVLLGDLRRFAQAREEPEADEPRWRRDARHQRDAPEAPDEHEVYDEHGEYEDSTYDGPLRVLQWEIDPTDAHAPPVQRFVNQGGWEFRVWWQRHRGGELFYASLQALREDWVDHSGIARRHPVGRTEAVNLVYDAPRGAVVAIYGTVRDFRPFVEAFRLAYGAESAQARPSGEANVADPNASIPDTGGSPTP